MSERVVMGWSGATRLKTGRSEHGVWIAGIGPALPWLELRAVPLGKARPLWIGDPSFDAAVTVAGDERVARALLDGPTREAVLALFEGGIERLRVRGRRWVARGPGPSAPEMVEGALLRIWSRVEAGSELERLLAVARFDPEVRVRAAAADRLLADGRSERPELRISVARALLDAPGLRPRHHADAAWVLAELAPREAVRLLDRWIRGVPVPNPALIDAYGAAAARAGQLEPVLDLARASRAAVAAAAVRSLSDAVDEPTVRGPVLERLRDGAPAVRQAAASALGHATVDLGPVSQALGAVIGGRSERPSVRRAAAWAVARVRRRAAPAGSVSLGSPAPEEGALSEASRLDLYL